MSVPPCRLLRPKIVRGFEKKKFVKILSFIIFNNNCFFLGIGTIIEQTIFFLIVLGHRVYSKSKGSSSWKLCN